jgi:hypothetical protein
LPIFYDEYDRRFFLRRLNIVAERHKWRCVWSAHAALLGHRADGCVDAARVTELLEPWGGEPAERYHRLFDPDGPLATTYGDADPGTWRPALRDLLRAGDRAAAINAARRHGYRLVEIAVELQVSEATVSRWARGLGGPTTR